MSHRGLWLRVTLAPSGEPHLGYTVDRHLDCPTCGKTHLLRSWLSTPLHTLTLPRATQLAQASRVAEPWTCDQCGDQSMEPPRRCDLALFLPSGGMIAARHAGGTLGWRLDAHTQPDAQRLPERMQAADHDPLETRAVEETEAVWLEALTEPMIAQALGRPLSCKAVVRNILERAQGTAHTTPGFLRLADGLAWTITQARPADLARDAARTLGCEETAVALHAIVQDHAAMPGVWGAPTAYLAGLRLPQAVWVAVDAGRWQSLLQAATEGWPVPVAVEPSEEGFVLLHRDNREDVLTVLSAADLAEEAALTLTPPADEAVLAAERALWVRLAARELE